MSAGAGTPSGDPRRWLFVSSAAMSDVAELLGWLRAVVAARDEVVLRRRSPSAAEVGRGVSVVDEPRAGVEAAAYRIAAESLRASVTFTDDPVAELASCDGWAVGVRDLDPEVVAVVEAAEELGLAGAVRAQGARVLRADAESRAGQERAWQVQVARDRNRSQRVRRDARRAAAHPASAEARQRARDAARPRARATNPTLGRRGPQEGNARRERGTA